jgi:hypothetical protein
VKGALFITKTGRLKLMFNRPALKKY